MILVDRFPCNRATRAEDEKTWERAEYEKFKWSAILSCATKLTTPVSIVVGRKLVVFWRRRSCCLCIGLSIIVMGKVIECLDCGLGFGMEWYNVFISACEAFEGMNCSLIVLWVGRIYVWGKKCENRSNVRTSASCKPIDVANNALIYLSSTWKISTEGINRRNGING